MTSGVRVVKGYTLHLELLGEDLLEIKRRYHIPTSVVTEVPRARCCDDQGFTNDLAILESHLAHGLRLPFYYPLLDILNLLDLLPPQFHHFSL